MLNEKCRLAFTSIHILLTLESDLPHSKHIPFEPVDFVSVAPFDALFPNCAQIKVSRRLTDLTDVWYADSSNCTLWQV